jgi:hypothetical protein
MSFSFIHRGPVPPPPRRVGVHTGHGVVVSTTLPLVWLLVWLRIGILQYVSPGTAVARSEREQGTSLNQTWYVTTMPYVCAVWSVTAWTLVTGRRTRFLYGILLLSIVYSTGNPVVLR